MSTNDERQRLRRAGWTDHEALQVLAYADTRVAAERERTRGLVEALEHARVELRRHHPGPMPPVARKVLADDISSALEIHRSAEFAASPAARVTANSPDTASAPEADRRVREALTDAAMMLRHFADNNRREPKGAERTKAFEDASIHVARLRDGSPQVVRLVERLRDTASPSGAEGAGE